jgi:hypothetical protein
MISHRAKLIITGAVAVVVVLVLSVAAISVNILRTQSTTSFARGFVRVFPIPAARVNGGLLAYRDVLKRWDTLDSFLKNPPQLEPGQVIPDRDVLRQQVYEIMIRETYLRRQAEKDSFALSDVNVDQNTEQLIQMSSSTKADFERNLKEMYGLTLQEFRDTIVRPATLEEGLAKRAELNGTSVEDWRKQIKDGLKSDQVKRYLKFSSPLPEETI